MLSGKSQFIVSQDDFMKALGIHDTDAKIIKYFVECKFFSTTYQSNNVWMPPLRTDNSSMFVIKR